MPTANPDNLSTVFVQVLDAVQNLTDEQMDKLEKLFAEVGALTDEITELPQSAKNKLDEITENPDWWSVLVFLMVQIAELDEQHLSVGAMQPDGWSRMLTLTYTRDEHPAAATLGLALIADKDRNGAALRRGLMLKISRTDPDGIRIPQQRNTIGVSLKSTADCTWMFGFGQSPQSPGHDVTVEAGLFYNPPDLAAGPAAFTTGEAAVTVTLKSAVHAPQKHYSLKVELGSRVAPAQTGVRGRVDFGSMLGVLADVVHIASIDEQYSPAYVLPDKGDPTFDLNHHSA